MFEYNMAQSVIFLQIKTNFLTLLFKGVKYCIAIYFCMKINLFDLFFKKKLIFCRFIVLKGLRKRIHVRKISFTVFIAITFQQNFLFYTLASNGRKKHRTEPRRKRYGREYGFRTETVAATLISLFFSTEL